MFLVIQSCQPATRSIQNPESYSMCHENKKNALSRPHSRSYHPCDFSMIRNGKSKVCNWNRNWQTMPVSRSCKSRTSSITLPGFFFFFF
uniref:Uncharacterized protein n=1 Tax=Caenorhabditis japonica TaxID=281687 RepID=A0A8R1EAL1_CAEJA